MKDLELRLTDLLARKADEVDVRPVDGFAEAPYMTALASTDPSVTEARDLIAIDLEPTSAIPAPKRNRRRVAQVILAVAAIVAIALLATRDGDDVTPADQPSPTVTVPPTTPPRALRGAPEDARLVPGTYFIDEVAGTPTPRIFVTVGEGWGKLDNGPVIYPSGAPGSMKEGGGFMMFSRPAAVFSDACHPSAGYHPGPVTTLDGLVAALTEQQGWAEVTAPSDIFIDGYVGKAFQRTAPADMSDCNRMPADYGPRVRTGTAPYAAFLSWEHDRGEDPRSSGGPYEPNQIETVWVLDIDGTVVLINTRPFPEASLATHAEFAAVLDSIRIDRA